MMLYMVEHLTLILIKRRINMAKLSGSGGALSFYAAKRKRIAEEQAKLQKKKIN